MRIRITFYADDDDIETAIALLQVDGKPISRTSVHAWIRDKYAGYGNQDVNSDLLGNAGVDLEDEDTWQAVLAVKASLGYGSI